MMLKKILHETPYIILFLLILGFLCTHSPNVEYDTPTYINFDAIRPPLYPMFIWLFHWAGAYQYIVIMWAQAIFLFLALLFARRWLRNNLQISDKLISLVCLITVTTISFHFQLFYIQSEGLSFPLFILIFFACIECFHKVSLKNICYLSALVSLLILTRLQFVYFYVIYVILCLWYIWKRVSIKPLLMSIFILFGSMSVTLLIDHSYHYFKHGFFGQSPYGGLLILVQELYLADNNVVTYFKDSQQKIVVQSMIDQRNQQGLNQDTYLLSSLRASAFKHAYEEYTKNYQAILNIIDRTLKTPTKNIVEHKTNLEANKIAIDIDKMLILHNTNTNVLFFIWKCIQCLGGVPQFLFFTILLVYLPIKILKDKIDRPPLPVIFIMTIVFLTLMNAFIIALCNPNLPSYFCYSQFMFYCLSAYLANLLFIHSAHLKVKNYDII